MVRRFVMPGRSGSNVTRREESVVARPIFCLIVFGSSKRFMRELGFGFLLPLDQLLQRLDLLLLRGVQPLSHLRRREALTPTSIRRRSACSLRVRRHRRCCSPADVAAG